MGIFQPHGFTYQKIGFSIVPHTFAHKHIGVFMALRTLNHLKANLQGKGVILRVDFNVPLTNDCKVADDTRIKAALPTIEWLQKQEAKIILCSHLGRPKGPTPKLSLEPVAAYLSELLNQTVYFCDVVEEPALLTYEMKNGEILLLENLRFHEGESSDSSAFAEKLALCGEYYINDAFGLVHRADASVHALAKIFSEKEKSFAGFLIEEEFNALSEVLNRKVNTVAVVGGSKVSDKIIMIENLTKRCKHILIGGAMAYTFLAAQKIPTGSSMVETDKVSLAEKLIALCNKRGVTLHLPMDHVVASEFAETATPQITEGQDIPTGTMALDIGPKTIAAYSEIIKNANCVFWNGPMGVFEWENFAAGTIAVAQALVDCTGYTVVGGGDSAAAVVKFNKTEGISHISTGGGASLAFLEETPLPGMEYLHYNV